MNLFGTILIIIGLSSLAHAQEPYPLDNEEDTFPSSYEQEVYADDVVGDKGVYSTAEDMFKWDQGLYTEKILKKATLEEAFTGYSNEHKGKRNYGYGWRLIEEEKRKVVYHNGWWHGYNSLFYRGLSDSTTVIILSNKDNRSIYHIEDVLTILNTGSNNTRKASRK